MKKFLKKKGVMYGFLTAAIAFLILYVCLLVRPVTTTTPYKGSYKYMGTNYEATYTFKGGNKVVAKTKVGSVTSERECWVAYDVYSYIQGPGIDSMTKKEFMEEVKDYKETNEKAYENMLIDVNAFRIKMEAPDGGTMVLRNTGAIVFAIVGGLVEAGLITFAVLSIMARKKK